MASSYAVELKGITKRFGAVTANSEVSLRVPRGSIHGIIGENGAGKSTAMKMLYGMYSVDQGQILIHGVRRTWSSPLDAIRAGIGMVHQHFMLAGPYSVLDNIILGDEPYMRRWGFLPWAIRPIRREQARKKLIKIAERYGFDVPWDAPVESLPVGVQQRVEILKLLYRDADILILDEPTAVLTPQEVTELFANLKKLKLEGKTILIITHKLKEVMEFTDHITVFRAGRVSGEVKTSETSPQDLANMMVGRKVLLQVEVPPQGECGSIALQASDLCFGKWLRNVNLKIRCGEIVGIAGIEGNGQSQLISAILDPANTDRLKSGRIEIFGNDVSHCSIAEILDQGVAVIPEDRQTQGLLLEQSVEENFLLGLHRLPRFTGGGWIRKSELRRSAGNAVRAYDVRPADLDWEAGGLSGGNQQKLIAAREFEKNPGFIIAAQPTRGVDVGAIEFLHRQLLKARTGGAGVLLVSSELDEVIGLSDRILVMYDGRFVGEFLRGSVTEQQLGLLMGGGVIHG